MVYRGNFGSVERVELVSTQPSAALGCWLLTIPGQAPVPDGWDQYALSVIHLRDVPGFPPAYLQFPEATHELTIITIDPDHRVTAETPLPWNLLMPSNATVQFSGVTDDQAVEVGEMCAKGCADGELPAETSIYMFPSETYPSGKIMLVKDLLDLWTTTVRTTAQHYTLPHHGTMN